MSFNDCSDILNKMSLNGNSERSFFDYVYYKISLNTQNRFVEKNDSSIDIILDKHPSIKVIPIYREFNKENPSIDKEMKEAIDIIQSGEFTYVYFVYPKNDNWYQFNLILS